MIASLEPGEAHAITCTASSPVTAADSGKSIVNEASVSAQPGGPHAGPHAEPVTDTAHADVEIPELTTSIRFETSVSPEVIDAPGTLTYTYVVENTGNVTLTNVALVDPLIDLAAVDCDAADGVQPLSTTLAVGADPITCTAPYAIEQAQIDAGGTIVTTAQVTSDQVDSGEASTTVTIEQRPELAVTKTVTSASTDLDAGDVVTYAIVVTNRGNVTLSDLAVSDPGADTLDCGPLPDTLAPEATLDCTASTTLTEADLLAGSYTNTVTVTALPPAAPVQPFLQAEPALVTATASATVTMQEVTLGLTIAKTVEPTGPVKVGETLTYTFVVTNTSNVGLADVVISDPLPGLVWSEAAPDGLIGDLPREEAITVTGTYVVTAGDVQAGEVANTAHADADDPTCADDDTQAFAQADDPCTVTSEPASVVVETVAEAVPATPRADAPITQLPSTGTGAGQGGILGVLLGLAAMSALLGVLAVGREGRSRR